jgi:hypothetical protein
VIYVAHNKYRVFIQGPLDHYNFGGWGCTGSDHEVFMYGLFNDAVSVHRRTMDVTCFLYEL